MIAPVVPPSCIAEAPCEQALYWCGRLLICTQALGAKCDLDFYIPNPYFLALAITRQGTALADLLLRFQDSKKYQALLANGIINRFAVVYFCCPPPEGTASAPPLTQDKQLFTVQFQAAYTAATIWHQGKHVDVCVNGSASAATFAALAAVLKLGASSSGPSTPSTAGTDCNGPSTSGLRMISLDEEQLQLLKKPRLS